MTESSRQARVTDRPNTETSTDATDASPGASRVSRDPPFAASRTDLDARWLRAFRGNARRDTPKRPADPLEPRTSRLVSNRAETVLGSRLTDDAIWPTPSTPAKVRRDPLSAATFSAPPAASALKTTTTRAVRAVAHFQNARRFYISRVRLFATTLEPDAVGPDTRSQLFLSD